jgi:hypothetical protein
MEEEKRNSMHRGSGFGEMQVHALMVEPALRNGEAAANFVSHGAGIQARSFTAASSLQASQFSMSVMKKMRL